MKASELRIGNLVKYMGREQPVTSEIIRECELNNATTWGIPLTEEKLESFGFVKRSADSNIFDHAKMSVALLSDGRWVSLTLPRADTPYLHQIQNLHKSLTGEELTPITK